jgi:hypothetical protein
MPHQHVQTADAHFGHLSLKDILDEVVGIVEAIKSVK